jgi:phosphonate transport system substrate-binding protein
MKRIGATVLLTGAGCLALAVAAFVALRGTEGVKTVHLGGAGPAGGPAPATVDSVRPDLRIAVAAMISPKSTRKYYEDLLRVVGARLGESVVFLQRRTYAEVNDLLRRKEVDLAFVCSGPYITGRREFGMELLAVPVVHGQKVYHSYILVGNDSSVERFGDLRGGRFAFTDPHSNTGCLVPRFMLARLGETPESFFEQTFFTGSHDNSIKAVAEGLADAGAVDSLIWEFLNAVDPTYTARTRIVEKSPPYGIPPVVVHPDLPAERKERLRKVFLQLHEDREASVLLGELRIERFGEGDDSMYDSVREMQAWLAGRAHAKS